MRGLKANSSVLSYNLVMGSKLCSYASTEQQKEMLVPTVTDLKS